MRADIQSALKTWERENKTTLAVFAAVPEGRNGQTVIPDKGWTLGGLIWHICISERWLCANIMGARPEGEPGAVRPMADDRRRNDGGLPEVARLADGDSGLKRRVLD